MASTAALILLAGACRSPYREAVLPESDEDPGGRSIVYVGFYDALDGTLDANATRQLAEASGRAHLPSAISAQDVDFLVGDPGLLAVDRDGRRRLAERIGARSVLIGVVRPIAVDEVKEWGDLAPARWEEPLAVFGERRGVPHEAIVIRLVDLERGEVESETLTITNRDRSERMENCVTTAVRVMRLGAAR